MRVRGGNGGWVEVLDAPAVDGRVHMRLRPDGRGVWKVRELYVCSDAPLSMAMLRQLPVDLVELIVNEDPDYLMTRANLPGPDLERLAALGSSTFGSQADHWVKDSLLAQMPGSGVPQPKMPKRRSGQAAPKRAPLRAPERLDDVFFSELADAYVDVVSQRQNPGPTLATEAGVSPRTVHRWILQARKRGFLPEGTQGRAGI